MVGLTVDVYKRQILHRGPEKVVLLTDTWSEQEAEHFVQLAKQQGRAVLLGRPTMGTLDYTNPVTVLYLSLIHISSSTKKSK